jgi:hypothetical protein
MTQARLPQNQDDRIFTRFLGREPTKPEGLANVCFGAHNGIKSDIAPCPKCAKFGSDAFTRSAPCHLLRLFKMPSSLPKAPLTDFRRPCRCLEVPRLKVR